MLCRTPAVIFPIEDTMKFSTRCIQIFSSLLLLTVFINQVEAQKKRPRKTVKRPVTTVATEQPTPSPTITNTPLNPSKSVEYGYLAGYNDGFTSGKSDYNASKAKDFQRSTLYADANRGYEKFYGDLGEFQRGYRFGYEVSYNDAYLGRERIYKIPANLEAMTTPSNVPPVASQPAISSSNPPAVNQNPNANSASVILNDSIFRIRLDTQISTKTNVVGDRFTAFVIEPKEFENATIEGHVADIKRAGKLTGTTQLSLDFDAIILKDGTNLPFHAQVEKVYATEKVKTVDEEGNVQTGSTTRDTTIRGAGGAAIGAIIGGIAGGGKGAAIGAILGAGVGAGSVYVQGNKDLIFDPGTELSVRTFGPRR
jgi:hypothetical protein